MNLTSLAKSALDRRGLRWILRPVASQLARWNRCGVFEISWEDGVWIHHTRDGCFAYNEPFVRLDLRKLDDYARFAFCWGYTPRLGDVIVDIGAGVGEETLTFSKLVGEQGKVIAIEAHPLTFRCLEKLVCYNHLNNVIPVHAAITGPSCQTITIENSRRYLRNRVRSGAGIPVPATTMDALYRSLGLGRIDFLKMNIEGAERLAIQAMAETLSHTKVLCICCHDFLADTSGDQQFRTKAAIQEFLERNGIQLAARTGLNLPPYLRCQIWGYNPKVMRAAS